MTTIYFIQVGQFNESWQDNVEHVTPHAIAAIVDAQGSVEETPVTVRIKTTGDGGKILDRNGHAVGLFEVQPQTTKAH